MRILILLSILFLMSCKTSEQLSPTITRGESITWVVVPGEGRVSITSVVLEDGTRCVALLGYKKGGLSCDWR